MSFIRCLAWNVIPRAQNTRILFLLVHLVETAGRVCLDFLLFLLITLGSDLFLFLIAVGTGAASAMANMLRYEMLVLVHG